MDPSARDRFTAARVGHLATVTPTGRPHVVPVVFALDPATGVLWTAVDAKPKRTRDLQRLRNIADNPRVSVLADHYAEDWTALWWVRADGRAEVLPIADDETTDAVALLTRKYPQYEQAPPPGPLVRVDVQRWASWSAAPGGSGSV